MLSYLRRLVATLVILSAWLAGAIAHAQDVLILTDASTAAINGATHVSSLIAAFTNAGASVVANTTELTNGAAMAPALVAGRDAAIVVSVNGPTIDAADVPVLQAAVNASASRAFMFFTDSCSGCRTTTTTAVLPIANSVGG